MDRRNNVRTRETQQVVVALQVVRMITQGVIAEILFLKLVLLQHGAGRTIEHDVDA